MNMQQGSLLIPMNLLVRVGFIDGGVFPKIARMQILSRGKDEGK
jgi:hypothetical protein